MSYVATPVAGVEMRCLAEADPVPYSFCINRVVGSDNPDVVFHFHGRNGDATWWNDAPAYSGELYTEWAESKRAPPTVVSVSFGPLWLLTDQHREDASPGLMKVFLESVVPRVGRELASSGGARRRYLLIGESMGAVNALLVGLKTSAQFSKVASLCAPLATGGRDPSIGQVVSLVRRGSMTVRRALMLLAFSRRFYPSDAFWAENAPLPLSERAFTSPPPAFFITCGRTDEWGCLEGSEVLVNNLRAHGARVDWWPRPGGHCDIDPRPLAAFLVD